MQNTRTWRQRMDEASRTTNSQPACTQPSATCMHNVLATQGGRMQSPCYICRLRGSAHQSPPILSRCARWHVVKRTGIRLAPQGLLLYRTLGCGLVWQTATYLSNRPPDGVVRAAGVFLTEVTTSSKEYLRLKRLMRDDTRRWLLPHLYGGRVVVPPAYPLSIAARGRDGLSKQSSDFSCMYVFRFAGLPGSEVQIVRGDALRLHVVRGQRAASYRGRRGTFCDDFRRQRQQVGCQPQVRGPKRRCSRAGVRRGGICSTCQCILPLSLPCPNRWSGEDAVCKRSTNSKVSKSPRPCSRPNVATCNVQRQHVNKP